MARKTVLSKIISKLPGVKQAEEAEAPRPKNPVIKMVFFIVDWNNANTVTNIFVEEKVRFHFLNKGKGTASSEILHLLGLGASDKAVVFCFEQAVMVPVLMKKVRKKLGFHDPGAGIAFSIPLSAINDPALLVFKQNVYDNKDLASEKKGDNMAANHSHEPSREAITGNNFTHDLIVAIVNHGYSEEVMNVAREAGASGGTMITARGQTYEGAVRFFGITVQEEREILLLLTAREKKVAIMQAICEKYGLNSKAHGLVVSLPVDNVMGLSFD